MNILTTWKPITFAVIVSLLTALQPALDQACSIGGHCGG